MEGEGIQLPESIRRLTASQAFTTDTLGMSGAQILCFEDRILKIEKQGPESDHEREMLHWLAGRLPVPSILAAESADGMNYLLMSRMQGELARSPALLHALEQLLQWLEDNRPPGDLAFSHGDFCLPNIFLSPQGGSGFIGWGRSGKLGPLPGYCPLPPEFKG